MVAGAKRAEQEGRTADTAKGRGKLTSRRREKGKLDWPMSLCEQEDRSTLKHEQPCVLAVLLKHTCVHFVH